MFFVIKSIFGDHYALFGEENSTTFVTKYCIILRAADCTHLLQDISSVGYKANTREVYQLKILNIDNCLFQ